MISSNNVKGEFAIMPEIVAKETIFVPICSNNPFSGILLNYCSLRVNLGTISFGLVPYPYNSSQRIILTYLLSYYIAIMFWKITGKFLCK